jgi:ABC-2 type transport system ATP-binding protein
MLLAESVVGIPPTAPPSNAVVIRIEGLTKRFIVPRRWADLLRGRAVARHATALEDVSLSASRGEIVGLLGPNGAGKTTLLKIASTLVLPDAGTVEISGVDVVRYPAQARWLIAPVSADERSLEWRLTARENLRFYGALHGLHGPRLRHRIEDLLAVVQLGDTADKLVGAFSSGMKQRLLIARGLLASPHVILLDEPTRSLDPLAARSFREFLRQELAGRHGCTILLATHDPEEALELCDRIAILDRGRVLASGSTPELIKAYSEEQYRIWVGATTAAAALEAVAPTLRRRTDLDTDAWTVVDVDLAPDTTADALLSALVHRGIPVGRFERIQLTLAELIQRVVQRSGRSLHA